jgi:glycosyltransferase involved in cell wall biosynthesis
VGLLTGTISRRGGGVSAAIRNLSRALLETHNIEVLVFAPADEATHDDISLWDGIPVKTFPALSPRWFCYCPELYAAVRNANLSLLNVSCTWLYLSLVSLKWMRESACPVVISPHGDLDPWALNNSPRKKRVAAALFERRHLERAACLHALNAAEARTFRAFGLHNPIAIVPNGVDIPALSAAGYRPPPWSWRAEKVGRVLLYLGRLHPKKNLTALLEAWSTASRDTGQCADWWLAIAGWDQLGYEAKLRQLLAASGAPRVLFLGPQYGSPKDACFRHASAFILPSLSEGLPNVVLEAWSYGLPVLMTPECNLPEGKLEGAAIEVSGTAEAIATGLRTLFSMRDADLARMGQAGRDLVKRKFAWPQVASQMLALYRWVNKEGAAPHFPHGLRLDP